MVAVVAMEIIVTNFAKLCHVRSCELQPTGPDTRQCWPQTSTSGLILDKRHRLPQHMRAFGTPPSSGTGRAPPAAAYPVPSADASGSALHADRIPGAVSE